jgi:hypothetical protein
MVFGVRARVNQDISHLAIVPMRRPMQRGGAVGLRSVHIHMLCNQLAHGFGIRLGSRIH